MDYLKLMTSDKGYTCSDFDLPKDKQKQARTLCFQYNQLDPNNTKARRSILKTLFGTCSDLTFVESNFQCDYGINIHTNGLVFINFNCVILDTSPVYIGQNCFIAPNVTIACASHPIDSSLRNQGVLISKPITIKDNVWIGANTTICGGVSIGENTVIGANSLITKDIPSNVVAFGNPCKIIRKITDQDKQKTLDELNKLKNLL